MTEPTKFKAFGNALGLFLAINYTVCVLFCIFFDAHMHQNWENWLFGFEWISWKTYFIGLGQVYLYGWYFALIWVPLYNCSCRCCGKMKN